MGEAAVRDMIARLVRALEPFAFGGGQHVCKFCGAGFVVREEDGMWRPNQHFEFCLLRQAEELAGLNSPLEEEDA